MSFRDSIVSSRMTLGERFNVLFKRGPQVDEDFWDDLEEALILSDVGGSASEEIVDSLREQATRKALKDTESVLALLSDAITDLFAEADPNPFEENPVCILFVGINGAGKTTTVGKLAKHAMIAGRKPLIGSADTFRAAAIEQLDVWGQRSGVEVVKRERGSDPASVCYDVIERSEQLGSDLVLIDTSGRLHTSDELMRELQKVVNVTRKRASIPVRTVLVIDATTGQNGLQQARKFNEALELDGVIMTKLDGTAKGGIAVAVSHELDLPVLGVGVGESIDDLQPFDAREYAEALFGDMRDGEFAEQLARESENRRAADGIFSRDDDEEEETDDELVDSEAIPEVGGLEFDEDDERDALPHEEFDDEKTNVFDDAFDEDDDDSFDEEVDLTVAFERVGAAAGDAAGETATADDASGEIAVDGGASGETAAADDASGETAAADDASGEFATADDASGETATADDASGEFVGARTSEPSDASTETFAEPEPEPEPKKETFGQKLKRWFM